MDTLTNVKAFLLVARTLSFARAADQLDVAPSVVSKRVRQLEAALGGRLFERTTHEVVLTELGDRVVHDFRRLDAEFDEILYQGRGRTAGLSGPLRIKLPVSLAMMGFDRLLGRFHLRHPNIELQVIAADRTVDPVEESVDVSLHGGRVEFDDVLDEPLLSYPRMLVGSRGYLRRHGRPATPQDLEQHTALLLDREDGWLRFENAGAPVLVKPRSQFVSNSLIVLLGAAIEHCGLLVVPTRLLELEDREGQLVEVLKDHKLSDRWVSAHVPASRKDNVRVRAFLDYVKREGGKLMQGSRSSRIANTEASN